MKTLLEANIEWIKRKKQPPPTVKDVLLEKWKNDTVAMIADVLELYWNATTERYEFPNGEIALCEADAEKKCAAYLNSPAEVEK